MDTINEKLELDESDDDDKYDNEYDYPFKCKDYTLNYVFHFLLILIVHAMFQLCIIKSIIFMYLGLTLIKA